MQVPVDSTFTPQLAVASPLTHFGARIEVPITRAIATAWKEAALVDGVWTVFDLETPVVTGEYQLVWRTGDPEPPEFELYIPLFVTTQAEAVSASGVDFIELRDHLAEIRPDVADIAALENTRTAAGGGGEIAEFNTDTRPTADQVDALIDQAVGAVLAQLPISAPVYYFDRVKHAIALYTAMLVEGSYYREELESGSVNLYRTLFNQAILSLNQALDTEIRTAFGATLLV